jgi:hypothetical protein
MYMFWIKCMHLKICVYIYYIYNWFLFKCMHLLLHVCIYFYSFAELVLNKYSRKPEVLHCLQNRTCGTYIRLHSCIRIIPSPTQGIDPFEVYATRNDNSRSGITGIKRARFDWIELLDAHNDNSFNGLYSQIAALVEVRTDNFHEFFFIGTITYKFLYVCI